MTSHGAIRVGVTGGIGSGKSVVCRIFSLLGAPVYDSDAAAKRLMSSNPAMIASIRERFGVESYKEGVLDRAYLASKVFDNQVALAALNALVHPAVAADFMEWVAKFPQKEYVVIESAILFESILVACVDVAVTVSAPERLRLKRASERDGSKIEGIRARMDNQLSDAEREELSDYVIENDEVHSVWAQVLELDKRFRELAAQGASNRTLATCNTK